MNLFLLIIILLIFFHKEPSVLLWFNKKLSAKLKHMALEDFIASVRDDLHGVRWNFELFL